MPYRRKLYGRSKSRPTRKSAVSTSSRGSRGKARKGKYTKVSRNRSQWQAATSVSPYRRFIYNDTGFTAVLSTIIYQTQNVFSGNSLYDPDVTGSGVQPYGFDQLCPVFYNNYNVKASKITVYPSVAPSYVTSFPPYFECLIVPYRTTTLPYNEVEDIRRMPYCRSIRFSAQSQGSHPTSLSSYASTKSILSREFANDVSATGQYDGNPTYRWYWFVIIDTNTWIPTANISVKFDVKIAYYTRLIRKVELNES